MSQSSTPPGLTLVPPSAPAARASPDTPPLDAERHRRWVSANRHLEAAIRLFDEIDAFAYASGTQDTFDVSKKELRQQMRIVAPGPQVELRPVGPVP